MSISAELASALGPEANLYPVPALPFLDRAPAYAS
jgi:hypothetical protein